MKGLINMIMGSGMDEFASEESSSLAMILATVGIEEYCNICNVNKDDVVANVKPKEKEIV